VFEREVRVLDDVEHIAVRVEDGRHPDAVAAGLNAVVLCCSEFKEPTKGHVRIVHTPVRHHAGAGAWGTALVRLQPELEFADVETDIKRLVEIRPDAEHHAVPFLRLVEITHVIDSGPQSV
jgi:hypothetical protein